MLRSASSIRRIRLKSYKIYFGRSLPRLIPSNASTGTILDAANLRPGIISWNIVLLIPIIPLNRRAIEQNKDGTHQTLERFAFGWCRANLRTGGGCFDVSGKIGGQTNKYSACNFAGA
jgi:hypothetical protein